MTSFVFSLLCLLLFICLFVLFFCCLQVILSYNLKKKSLETILLFCLGQHRRHSTFNFPSITDVSITGADRAHPFEDSFRKLWREFDKRSGLGCSKAGQRHLPNKSLSSGQCNWFPQYLSAGLIVHVIYPVDRAIQRLNNRGLGIFP